MARLNMVCNLSGLINLTKKLKKYALIVIVLFENFTFILDSMKQWDIILKRLEKYTEPSGHSAWQKWWDAQKGYDDYSNNNDMPDLTEQFRGAVPVLNELAPHLKGSFLPNALRKVATECAELVKKLDNGGTMKDIDAFLVIVSREMNKAMDATPL